MQAPVRGGTKRRSARSKFRHVCDQRVATWTGVALLVVPVLVFATLDLRDERIAGFFSDHQFFTAVVTEALLLIGVYLIIERSLEARQEKRWRRVAEPSLRELRTAAVTLRRGIVERGMDLPERHASLPQIETVQRGVLPLLDAFERALNANRPTLTASPALAAYSVAAERVRVDSRLFLNSLSYARGGVRSGEWVEQAWRQIDRTFDEFERVYSDVHDDSGYVARLRYE